MRKLTKQEQKLEALEAYEAIIDPAYEAMKRPQREAFEAIAVPAWKAFLAKCKEIDEQEEDKLVNETEVWRCGMCGKSGGNRKFMEDHQCSKTKQERKDKMIKPLLI